MKYDDFSVVFSMIEADYYLCETTAYFKDKRVVVPAISDKMFMHPAVPSSRFSEYKELSAIESSDYEYNPMVGQAHALYDYISGISVELNNVLETLKILEVLC